MGFRRALTRTRIAASGDGDHSIREQEKQQRRISKTDSIMPGPPPSTPTCTFVNKAHELWNKCTGGGGSGADDATTVASPRSEVRKTYEHDSEIQEFCLVPCPGKTKPLSSRHLTDTERAIPHRAEQQPLEYMKRRTIPQVQRANIRSRGAAVAPLEKEYPTIDISPWMPHTGSIRRKARTHSQSLVRRTKGTTLRQILKQATAAGSFHITGHQVPHWILTELERTSKEFFHMPLEEKTQFTGGMQTCGFNAETCEWYTTLYPPSSTLAKVCNKDAPAEFQQAMDAFLAHAARVSVVLHRIFTEALALEKDVKLPPNYLSSTDDSAASTQEYGALRCFRDLHESRGYNTLYPHADLGSLTISYLPSYCLEEIRDGRWTWVPPCAHGELHVSIGHVLHYWSNGLFEPNLHRVVGGGASFDYMSVSSGAAMERGVEPVCSLFEKPRFGPISGYKYFSEAFETHGMDLPRTKQDRRGGRTKAISSRF